MLKFQLDRKRAENDKYEKEIGHNKGKADEIQKQIDALKTKIDEARREIAKLNEEVEKRGEKEQLKIHKEVEQLRVDLATGNTKIASIKNELSRIESRKEQLKKNLDDI